MVIQHSSLIISFFLFFFPSYTTAYTWQFTSSPRQCQNVSIAIQGSGQPPYSLLLLPTGPAPFPNKTDPRSIQTFPFTGNSTTLSFDLNYPENSSFVAVVSDSSGFGTGGTSIPITVLQSSDSSCYDPTHNYSQWIFYADPTGSVTQCEPNRWWWYQDDSAHRPINGTVYFYGVIPGGDSFIIPQGPLSTISTTSGLATGFNWTADIQGGTDFIIVGNDDSQVGAGGVAHFTIGPTTISSCLNSTSPSSTAGSPAGGTSYPTGSVSNSQSGPGGRSNTGVIAGGVVGGLALVVAILLMAFFYPRRGYAKERHVNVLPDDEEDKGPHYLPHYAPEPFLVPDSSASEATFFSRDRPLPKSPADISYPQGTSVELTTMRKSTLLGQPQPVTIIQHDDAGPSGGPSVVGEHRTIELPPAYGNIRPVQSHPSIDPPAATHTETTTP